MLKIPHSVAFGMTGVSKSKEEQEAAAKPLLPAPILSISLGVIPNATEWSEESHVIHFYYSYSNK